MRGGEEGPGLLRRPGERAGREVLLLAGALLLLSGCSALRPRLSPGEGRAASEFFRSAGLLPAPSAASFAGVAVLPDREVPVVAAVRTEAGGGELAGVYDPAGRGVLFLRGDGVRIDVERGPAAGELPEWLPGSVEAHGLSLGRVLSGAPGYPPEGGQVTRSPDGGWTYEDARQRLRTDPARGYLTRAEYRVRGNRVVVRYPGRDSPALPETVELRAGGGSILLRREGE